jgi:hypothetical protein
MLSTPGYHLPSDKPQQFTTGDRAWRKIESLGFSCNMKKSLPTSNALSKHKVTLNLLKLVAH